MTNWTNAFNSILEFLEVVGFPDQPFHCGMTWLILDRSIASKSDS